MKKLVLIALLVSSPAFAGDIYVAGSIGQSDFGSSSDKDNIDRTFASLGLPPISSTLDTKGTGIKLQLGYQFNPNFAVEGGYVDLGKTSYSANVRGGNINISIKASGFNVAAVGIVPINESFSLFGKIGAINGKVEPSVSASGVGGSAVVSTSSTNWSANYGFGGVFHVSKQLGIRLEYERFSDLGDETTTVKGDVDLLSAGLMFKF